MMFRPGPHAMRPLAKKESARKNSFRRDLVPGQSGPTLPICLGPSRANSGSRRSFDRLVVTGEQKGLCGSPFRVVPADPSSR
jgi:hypothetical protein